MKKIIFIILSLCINPFSYSQEEIITKNEIPALNAITDSLENNFSKNKIPQFKSLPQTTGHYFDLKTEFPDDFIDALKNEEPLDSLIKIFPNLQIDRDLLIIKNMYTLQDGEQKMEIKSFQIKNSRDHRITLEYSDSLDKKDLKFYFTSYRNKKTNSTNLRGFYLKKSFSQHFIPKEYAEWIHYTDNLVLPETELFLNNAYNDPYLYGLEKTVIDSLVNYYAKVTGKPAYNKERDFFEHRKLIDEWEGKRGSFSDSLFKNDAEFSSLLLQALEYAENNKKSNGELELFVGQLISKKRALNLLRFNQQTGSCSFDNGPIEQQKRMARLAAEIPDWGVFIKSFLNVMNDNVSRVANSNIASNSRKTYVEELTKLKLDVKTLLLGSNMRIEDTLKEHYFSDGSKIGKAFSILEDTEKDFFEKTIEDIIKDKAVDPFNKLHFYNTIGNYHFFLEDSLRKTTVFEKIEDLAQYMPVSIKSRIENPNKELTDLLFQERNKLAEFNILDSTIGNIYSYSYGGDCWMAEIQEKDGDPRIIYDLTMPVEDTITPLSNFLEKRSTLTHRIENHKFIKELLEANPENKLYLKFTKDRSFANYNNKVLNDMPTSVKENLSFENAISFYISYPDRRYVRYILLENNQVIILKIPKDFSIPKYSFEDLLTKKTESFLSVTYESYKLFNEKGEMLN